MTKITHQSASGLHGGEAKDWWRGNRTQNLIDLCDELGVPYRKLTEYQIRVGNAVDFYVTNGRVHDLKSNKRFDYHTYDDAKRIIQHLKV